MKTWQGVVVDLGVLAALCVLAIFGKMPTEVVAALIGTMAGARGVQGLAPPSDKEGPPKLPPSAVGILLLAIATGLGLLGGPPPQGRASRDVMPRESHPGV